MRWLTSLAFMWQLCFLWGFRLRVTPLSLSLSCVTHYKTSSEHLFPRVTLNRSNCDSVLWKAKAICGTTSLRVTILALFYESVKRGTKTIRKSKKTTTTNWINEVKAQPHQKLKQFVPRMYGTLFLRLVLVYLLRTSKRNFPCKVY